ncbi:hypothetical protein GB931_14635 [Modestobacter sp. I12A-02628]|uniref:Uncharacterized protein n=1 Tax=Goekera deserti TaxID=2497753 RepID=A0A7K3W9Z8_9ACTN|nr:hypothetical protein [Goekera deserti]MPQ99133.1 hypothetical protein [Goekera deserti]NDI47467.1 hypothetical protein [Goekera deserti]NEL53278.1 hypothetical protein [Goekera deserti]
MTSSRPGRARGAARRLTDPVVRELLVVLLATAAALWAVDVLLGGGVPGWLPVVLLAAALGVLGVPAWTRGTRPAGVR